MRTPTVPHILRSITVRTGEPDLLQEELNGGERHIQADSVTMLLKWLTRHTLHARVAYRSQAINHDTKAKSMKAAASVYLAAETHT